MTVSAGNKADFQLPGDLGEHDPRRMEHPVGNEPGSGGHEVKPNSAEVLGEHNTEPTAANNDPHSRNPGRDNTEAHAFEGGSAETMDRAKRQTQGGLRDGESDTSRAGHQQRESSGLTSGLQQSTSGHHGHHHDHTHGQGQGYDGTSSVRGPGQEGNFVRDQESSRSYEPTGASGIAGATGHHHDHTHSHTHGQGLGQEGNLRDQASSGSYAPSGLSGVSGATGDVHGHHQNEQRSGLGGTGAGFTGRDNYQSGTEPISGHRGTGVGGAPYDAGNIQEPGVGGSAPQHSSTFGSHNTRAGELLDPASGKETGIPGYGTRQ